MKAFRTYRDLRPIPLESAFDKPGCVITMSPGQWDGLLSAAYERGWVLIEIDEHEQPVRAYQRAEAR